MVSKSLLTKAHLQPRATTSAAVARFYCHHRAELHEVVADVKQIISHSIKLTLSGAAVGMLSTGIRFRRWQKRNTSRIAHHMVGGKM